VFLNEPNELRLCVDRDGAELKPQSPRAGRRVARGQPKVVAVNVRERASVGQRSAFCMQSPGVQGAGVSVPDFHRVRTGRKPEKLDI
jgi:hypothetical protein